MLQPVKTSYSSGIPVFQTVLETAQGGFSINATNLVAGATIPQGSVMGYDEVNRVARPLKTMTVYEDASNSATAIKVYKNHVLKTGDYVAKTVGGAAYAASAIDTSNAAYDVITVGTTLGVALTAGDVLFQSSATGASAAAYVVTPKGLLYEPAIVGVDQSCSVVIRGTIYARRAPGATAAIQALMPNIIYSQSF